jgi:acetylornithine/N-succinyldiaminopimelate aminotransferase
VGVLQPEAEDVHIMKREEKLNQEQQQALVDKWRVTYSRHVHQTREEPKVIAGALVTDIFDSKKKRYLDFTAGGGVLPMGHQDPLVKASVSEVMDYFYQTGPFGENIHGVQMELIDSIVPYLRSNLRFVFVASENEAMLNAVAMAKKVTPSKKMSSVVVANSVRQVPFVYPSARMSKDQDPESMGVVIVRPIDPDTYKIIEPWEIDIVVKAKSHGATIIWDETVTGFGWTGEMFSAPKYADFIVMGGALGGGVPLGAVVGDYIVDIPTITGRQNVLGASDIGITSGLHTMRRVMAKLSDESVRNLSMKIDTLISGLVELAPGLSSTGQGLLRGLVFDQDGRAEEVRKQCQERGILLRSDPVNGRTLQITCPMTMTAANVNELFGVLGDLLVGGEHDRPE